MRLASETKDRQLKILVIGYGSIGKRHAGNVLKLGHEPILLRHSKVYPNLDGLKEYHSLDAAIGTEKKIDGAVVCSPTSYHLEHVKLLMSHDIPFLLEKPPTESLASTYAMREMINAGGFEKYDIAFNMRYYPALQFIKNFMPNLGEVYSARVYAGHYLPEWRKNVDYRQTSSAKKELGGGVHIELVHEIDYILWLFGHPEKILGYLNKISNLEISTEDICSAIFRYGNGSIVELHLDYLSRKRLRGCQIIAKNGTLEWDINSGAVYFQEQSVNTSRQIFVLSTDYDFNDTYVSELKNFIGLVNGENHRKVGIADGIDIMKIVAAIEQSSEQEKWIDLNHLNSSSGE